MSGPNVRVTIQLGRYPSQEDTTFVFPLEEHLLHETMTPIDYPSANADILTRAFICTTPSVIKAREIDRRRVSEALSKLLTQHILDKMGARDTVMGYPKPSPVTQPGESNV